MGFAGVDQDRQPGGGGQIELVREQSPLAFAIQRGEKKVQTYLPYRNRTFPGD